MLSAKYLCRGAAGTRPGSRLVREGGGEGRGVVQQEEEEEEGSIREKGEIGRMTGYQGAAL